MNCGCVIGVLDSIGVASIRVLVLMVRDTRMVQTNLLVHSSQLVDVMPDVVRVVGIVDVAVVVGVVPGVHWARIE